MMARVRKGGVQGAAAVLLQLGVCAMGAAASPDGPVPVADTIYAGGPVISMDPRGTVLEAVAVRDGRILASGSRALIDQLRGPETRLVDLGGHALLPGFIDPHSHLMQAVSFADWANVTQPPVGKVDSIPSVLRVLRDHRRTPFVVE